MRRGLVLRLASAALILSVVAVVSPVKAGAILNEPVLGGRLLVASGGRHVMAQFLGSNAGYNNYLFVDGQSASIFDKQTPIGTEIDLGLFSAGTELVFRLDVSNTGLSYFTGDAQRNPDGLEHALTITGFDAVTSTYLTDVGFEDLYNGGDRDYNDLSFRLFNVIDPPSIPEPASIALLGLGIAGMSYQRRRKTAKA